MGMAASSRLTPLSSPRRLRIGVLLDRGPLLAVHRELLSQLSCTDYLQLAMIAVVSPRLVRHGGSPGVRALIKLYRWMDSRTSGCGAAEAARLLTSCTENRSSETILFEGANEKLPAALAARKLMCSCLSPFGACILLSQRDVWSVVGCPYAFRSRKCRAGEQSLREPRRPAAVVFLLGFNSSKLGRSASEPASCLSSQAFPSPETPGPCGYSGETCGCLHCARWPCGVGKQCGHGVRSCNPSRSNEVARCWNRMRSPSPK